MPATRPRVKTDYNSIDVEAAAPDFEGLLAQLDTAYPDLNSARAIDASLHAFYAGLRHIIAAHCPKKRTYPLRPEWWTDAVERKRREYLRKKNIFYRNRELQDRDHLHNQMSNAKQAFKQELSKAKHNAWRRFAEEDLQENPWGVLYKLAAGKITQRGPPRPSDRRPRPYSHSTTNVPTTPPLPPPGR